MEPGTLNVGDPQIVRDLAHHNGVDVVEHDGWIHARLGMFVYKAEDQAAAPRHAALRGAA